MNERYGAKVRWLRGREGLRALARRLDITPSYLSDIEHERRLPSPEVSDRIADALGIDRDSLWLLAVAERVARWSERERRSVLAALSAEGEKAGDVPVVDHEWLLYHRRNPELPNVAYVRRRRAEGVSFARNADGTIDMLLAALLAPAAVPVQHGAKEWGGGEPDEQRTIREAARAVDDLWMEPDLGTEDARDGLIWMTDDEDAMATALRTLRSVLAALSAEGEQ